MQSTKLNMSNPTYTKDLFFFYLCFVCVHPASPSNLAVEKKFCVNLLKNFSMAQILSSTFSKCVNNKSNKNVNTLDSHIFEKEEGRRQQENGVR